MTTIKSDRMSIVVSSKGAELQSVKDASGLEYLWQADPAFWPRRSPLLFPIVGALPGGEFRYQGRAYKLGNHGFVRDREFILAASGSDFARYELESDEASLALYPFRFLLAATYRVEANRLRLGWEVENRDTAAMHFSIGAHPAFRAPLLPRERREDYDIIFERKESVNRLFLNSDNVLSGERARFLEAEDRFALRPELFEAGAIVLDSHVSRIATLKSRTSGRFVEVSFPGFPALGIWSPKGDVPFVCIEPWYGIMPLANSDPALERKAGCLKLAPGERFSAEYSIAIA